MDGMTNEERERVRELDDRIACHDAERRSCSAERRRIRERARHREKKG